MVESGVSVVVGGAGVLEGVGGNCRGCGWVW